MPETSFRDHGFIGFSEAVVIDVETTGLDPKNDRVVSFAAIRVDFDALRSAGTEGYEAKIYEGLVNPERSIPTETTVIHGISDEHVKHEPPFADCAKQLRELIGDLPLIGHNVQFDKRFLNEEFKRAGVKSVYRNKSYCTMNRAKEHLGYTGQGFRKVSLERAAEIVGTDVRVGKNHNSVEDAQIALQVAAAFYVLDNGHAKTSEKSETGATASSKATQSASEAATRFVFALLLLGLVGLAFYFS